MLTEELKALIEQSTRQFNELKVEEGAVQNRLTQIDTRLKQLQGEHEAYKKMLQNLLERTPQPDDSSTDPATFTPDPFKSKAKNVRNENEAGTEVTNGAK